MESLPQGAAYALRQQVAPVRSRLGAIRLEKPKVGLRNQEQAIRRMPPVAAERDQHLLLGSLNATTGVRHTPPDSGNPPRHQWRPPDGLLPKPVHRLPRVAARAAVRAPAEHLRHKERPQPGCQIWHSALEARVFVCEDDGLRACSRLMQERRTEPWGPSMSRRRTGQPACCDDSHPPAEHARPAVGSARRAFWPPGPSAPAYGPWSPGRPGLLWLWDPEHPPGTREA